MPGVEGPAIESLIACQPSAALTTSDSKNSPRYCVARGGEEKQRVVDRGPVLRAVPASLSSDGSSPAVMWPGFGGVVSISGPTTLGEPAERVLELGQAAGVGGRVATELGLRGGDVVAEQQPLAVREPVEGRARPASILMPRSASCMSRQTGSRSMLIT